MSMMPGAELDRLVAEAVGCENLGELFRPSEDANHALAAAERFGLFGNYHCKLRGNQLKSDLHGWYIDQPHRNVSMADSPAHAICLAILKLREAAVVG